MGLIILIVTGALLGWLATIALRIEDGRNIFRNVAAGVFGSLGAGLVASGGAFLGAIRADTILWAMLGSIVMIALYNFVREKAFG